MSWMQRISAYAAILAFGVHSVLMALLGNEIWPFLDYRMYTEAKFMPESDWLALVGRTDNGAPFPLDDEQYIVPFAPSELLRALDVYKTYTAQTFSMQVLFSQTLSTSTD
jgi:hypothetical protein